MVVTFPHSEQAAFPLDAAAHQTPLDVDGGPDAGFGWHALIGYKNVQVPGNVSAQFSGLIEPDKMIRRNYWPKQTKKKKKRKRKLCKINQSCLVILRTTENGCVSVRTFWAKAVKITCTYLWPGLQPEQGNVGVGLGVFGNTRLGCGRWEVGGGRFTDRAGRRCCKL